MSGEDHEVGGVHYLGDRLGFGAADLTHISRQAVQDSVDTLNPSVGVVTVDDEPGKPRNSVLERGSGDTRRWLG